MANITKLNVMLTASTKGLSAGISKAQGMLKGLSKDAQRMRANFNTAFNKIGTGASRAFMGLSTAAAAAGASIAYLTKNSIDAVGDTNDFAKSLGLTYNELRKIQFAAGQAGVDSEALNASFAKMSDTLGSAMGGNASAIKAFENIGLSVEKLQRMSPGQQFEAIANAINRIQDPSQKMAAARDIFGKSGGALISLFDGAGAAIREAGTTLDTFGISLSQLDVTKIDNAGDSMGEMSLLLEGIGNQLAANVAPYISQIADDTLSWLESMGGVGPAMDAMVGGALDKLDSLLNKINEIKTAYNDIAKNITGGVGWVADKVADAAKATGISDAVRTQQSENRINNGIAPKHQAEARRILAERGGFQQEGITARRIANEMNISSRQYAGAAEASSKQTQYGESFRQWRAKANTNADIAAGVQPVVPMAPPRVRTTSASASWATATPGAQQAQSTKSGGEDITLLRQIAQNTGKNTIAYAG